MATSSWIRLVVGIIFLFHLSLAELQPFGLSTGDIQLPQMDDGTVDVELATGMPFFNQSFYTMQIGANGNINFHYPGVELGAFMADIDTRGNCSDNKIYYRQEINRYSHLLLNLTRNITSQLHCEGDHSGFNAIWATVITFYRVVSYPVECGKSRNTFQIILTTDGSRTFAIFNYQQLEWWTLTDNTYFATAGFLFSAGNYSFFHQLPWSGTANFDSLLYTSNIGVPGSWMFAIHGEQIGNFNCTSPFEITPYTTSPAYQTTEESSLTNNTIIDWIMSPCTNGGGIIPPMIIECSNGRMNISNDFNNTDASTLILTVDNTLLCRQAMHAAHSFLLPRRQLETDRHYYDPTLWVVCRGGKTQVSDAKPNESEATQLTFYTTGHLQCRVMFMQLLQRLYSMKS